MEDDKVKMMMRPPMECIEGTCLKNSDGVCVLCGGRGTHELPEKDHNCHHCMHKECCVYLWKFVFKGTNSRIKLRENMHVGSYVNCGHFMRSE